MITREEIELAENIGALSFEQGANMRSLVAEVERLTADNAKLRAEVERLKSSYSALSNGYAQLLVDNAKLRGEIYSANQEVERLRDEVIALEGVAEVMNCGHERRFSTLEIGAIGNEMTCARCEVERLKIAEHMANDRILTLDMHKQALKAEVERLTAQVERKCQWTIDTDFSDEIWETSCNEAIVYDEGSPTDNGVKFCPYCGGAVEFVEDGE